MKRVAVAICVAVLVLMVVPAARAQTVPDGFEVELLATGLDQPKGVVSALHRAGAGPFGHDLHVAVSGTNEVVTVDKYGAGAFPFTPVGPPLSFPVGVAFSGGPFGRFLYVGNAFGGGISQVDTAGNVSPMPFALPAMGIAGLDFGRGPYGHDLYAGEWGAGNIWRVDPTGNANLFSANPGTQTRYLKFSHGGAFGTRLYYTDFSSGDIYEVDFLGGASSFASTGDAGLEGLDFSPGGAFGHYLYAGSLGSGKIYQVAPDGTVTLWASGFGGVADIHFEPGKRGGFTMYIVTGQGCDPMTGTCFGSVYAISKQ